VFKKFTALVAAMVLVVSGAGCAQAAKAPSTLAGFYSQELNLTNCGGGFKCAKVFAPINWSKPSAGSITLSVTYKPVAGSTKFLFVNPGGPGASGVDFVRDNLSSIGTAKLRAAYNIVGFDPRGTKGSAPIKCLSASATDDFLYSDTGYETGTAADLAASRAAIAKFVAACKRNTGAVLGFVDTVSAARDLELLRRVFGSPKLDYLGFSYGTFLGTTYAALFPKLVGRFVLDGAIDPTTTDEQQSLNQLRGFDLALKAYMADCIANTADCPFSGSVANGLTRVKSFFASLERNPLSTDDGRKLTVAAGSTGMYLTLYSNEYWTYLTQAFNEAFDSQDGTTFMRLADFYNSRNQDGSYQSNELEANIGINCMDKRSSDTDAARLAQNRKVVAASPTLGKYWQNGSLLCAKWPFPVAKRPASYAAIGAPTIMVIGTTGDPATPYTEAVSLAHKILKKGFLVTFQGEGHTAYGRSNSCVANAVDNFLVAGKLPASEPRC
jgi:pimeloyl-ACP methyl ester carboxylesterase